MNFVDNRIIDSKTRRSRQNELNHENDDRKSDHDKFQLKNPV